MATTVKFKSKPTTASELAQVRQADERRAELFQILRDMGATDLPELKTFAKTTWLRPPKKRGGG